MSDGVRHQGALESDPLSPLGLRGEASMDLVWARPTDAWFDWDLGSLETRLMWSLWGRDVIGECRCHWLATLFEWCVSSGVHVNASTQSFPAGHGILTKWSNDATYFTCQWFWCCSWLVFMFQTLISQELCSCPCPVNEFVSMMLQLMRKLFNCSWTVQTFVNTPGYTSSKSPEP